MYLRTPWQHIGTRVWPAPWLYLSTDGIYWSPKPTTFSNCRATTSAFDLALELWMQCSRQMMREGGLPSVSCPAEGLTKVGRRHKDEKLSVLKRTLKSLARV